jgi:hypothetical protein
MRIVPRRRLVGDVLVKIGFTEIPNLIFHFSAKKCRIINGSLYERKMNPNAYKAIIKRRNEKLKNQKGLKERTRNNN